MHHSLVIHGSSKNISKNSRKGWTIQFKDKNALNTVGYKELFNYFDSNLELDEAIEEIKKNTRRLAKRQLTWFRNDKTINWFLNREKNKIIDTILK